MKKKRTMPEVEEIKEAEIEVAPSDEDVSEAEVDEDVSDWEDDSQAELEDDEDEEEDDEEEDEEEDDEEDDEEEDEDDEIEEAKKDKEEKKAATKPAEKTTKTSEAKVEAPVKAALSSGSDAKVEPVEAKPATTSDADATMAADDDDSVSVSSYSSEDSEDEYTRNRIGNVPMWWYDDHDHVGYDLAGEKVVKTLNRSEIDKLLEAADNPKAWRTIQDIKEQREVVLSATDLEVIRRLRNHQFPDKRFNDEGEFVEFDNPDSIHPCRTSHPSKRGFVPSKWEQRKVKKLVMLIRQGKIRPPPPPKPEVFDIWTGDTAEEMARRAKGPVPLPPPKMALPGHAESYNPPKEYLYTEDEKKQWEDMFETDRPLNFIPQSYPCLRRVPAYKNFIQERFERCLDLYLVPRAMKKRMNVDPESLLPQLPATQDLRPFPTQVSITYEGHRGFIRCLHVDPTGQWMATASDDKTLRLWEVASGRCFTKIQFKETVTAVAWNPVHRYLAVAVEEIVYMVIPKIPYAPNQNEEISVEELLKVEVEDYAEDTVKHIVWRAIPETDPRYKVGCRISLKHVAPVKTLHWHHKGSYLAALAPFTPSPNGQCIIHSMTTQKSMMPFKKMTGLLQSAVFHPNKPVLFVASQRSVRMFDLQTQKLVKTLTSGAKWIANMDCHISGEHLLVGTYDRRLIWFDLELGSKPFKTFRYHNKAIRDVAFHKKYPLMASASDDGTTHVLHAKVFNDFVTNPLIVPVKKLTGQHKQTKDVGVMSCMWHPTQPWLFTSGGDGQIVLWV